MKQANVLIGFLGIFLGVQMVFGQTEGTVGVDPRHPVPEWLRKVEEKRERDRPLNGIGRNGMMINREINARRVPVYKGAVNETEELMKAFERTRSMLVVPPSYFEKYKSLLKDGKVELARLQPDKNCYISIVVSVEDLEKCYDVVPVPGGGSFYSFRDKSNFPIEKTFIRTSNGDITKPDKRILTFPRMGVGAGGNWWNIHFINNNFDVANDTVQGIIAEIGDVGLENLKLKSKEFEFLNDFEPSETLEEVRGRNETLKKGIKFNNFTYSNSTSMKLNSTYVLRSVDYHSNLRTKMTGNKQADITVALKVVGRENDGSIIILWKELKSGRLAKKSK